MKRAGPIYPLLFWRQLFEIVRDQRPRLGTTDQYRTQNGSPRFHIPFQPTFESALFCSGGLPVSQEWTQADGRRRWWNSSAGTTTDRVFVAESI